MRQLVITSLIAILLQGIVTNGYTSEGLAVRPFGMAVSVEPGDTLQSALTLSNPGNHDRAYTMALHEVDQQGRAMQQFVGRGAHGSPIPSRDRRGDPDNQGYYWIDNAEQDGPQYQWIDITNRQGAQRLNAADNWNSGVLDLGFEFPWYGEWYTSVRVCSNGWFTFDPNQDGTFTSFPQFPDQQAPNNIIGVDALDLTLTNNGSMWFWTDGQGTAVISWISMIQPQAPVHQLITMQVVLTAETGTVLFQYGQQMGLQVNQVNVGYENLDGRAGANIYYHAAGVADGLAIAITGPFSKWLIADPRQGVVANGESGDISLQFVPGDMDAGNYEMRMGIGSVNAGDQDAADSGYVELSMVMTVSDPVASITGAITDAAGGAPIENVTASLSEYLISRKTDGNGQYAFEDLPLGNYHVSFSAPGYLPNTSEVDLGEGGAEENVGLLHGECNLSLDRVEKQIAPNTDTQVRFAATNDGNGLLTYSVDRRLIGDANAAPWENRLSINAGANLGDDRIEGVAFDGEHFYLAGANGNDPNTIYVLDRDGNEVDSYTQLGASQYGMKDLEWDGELLWGAGYLQNVYGFRPNGDSVISFQTAYNPTGNIAYDSDEDLLWVSGTTSNISAYDRQGHAANRTLNRKGLKIYGLAYWPEDPDGYNLYIFDAPGAGYQMVHKMNVESGDTMLAHSIPVENGESPGGAFICNTYDVYSWVMMTTQNNAPANGGDRVSIWQLEGRKDWMQVNPAAGEIEAGGHQDFDLRLDATGLPAVEFDGELVFEHDGRDGETHLPIALNVVEGPVHSDRVLNLDIGWNLVSANLQPDEHDVTVLTQGLVEADQLVIMKDGEGNFYRPQSHFNNIPGWNVAQGYLLKVTEATQLQLTGMTVMADDPINLVEGWQIVSYYPRHPIDATVALAGIADHLVIAKDGAGNFYLPSRHFSNMGQMVESQGYMMKTDADVELVYQAGNRAAMVETGGTPVLPSRYPLHAVTGANMSLLLDAPGVEGEIGVYAEDMLVGSGALDRGVAGIAIWGDDPTTVALDGAKEGDLLELRLSDGSGERRLSVAVLEADDKNVAPAQTGEGELTYQTDGLAVATAIASEVPRAFGLTRAFPNPFNSVTSIGFNLPEAAKVSLRVFDVSGREVAALVNGQMSAGKHAVVWNANLASAGVYLVKLESESGSSVLKLMLVK